MTREIRKCPLCMAEVKVMKTVACVVCRRKLQVCGSCAPTFTGCDKECREKHRGVMKLAFGNKGLIDLSEGRKAHP